MANLTITVDDAVLRSARVKAIQQGTSVNAYLRSQLEAWVRDDGPATVLDALLELAATHRSGLPERPLTRDELHER